MGIIPAGAGLTGCFCVYQFGKRDHPRGCGAHCNAFDLVRIHKGSSPRVRGSLVRGFSVPRELGIIPAGAGLTFSNLFSKKLYRDHPRGCGAHCHAATLARHIQGSSPRVRGSPAILDEITHVVGIIPAGAGLTSRRVPMQNEPWDHPRGCGAHFLKKCLDLFPVGSSPRVRGSQSRMTC